MGRWKKWTLLGLGALLLAATAFIVPTVWFKPYSVNHFYGRVFLRFALESPMLLSELGFLPPFLDFHSHKLDDVSQKAEERSFRRLERELRVLRSFDRGSIDDTISYDVMKWFMADLQESQRFRFHWYPLNQFSGAQSRLPSFMLSVHQIRGKKDARNYVRRLEAFERYFDQIIEGSRMRAERGIVSPRFVVQRVLVEMREFIAPPPSGHVLYTNLKTAADTLTKLSAGERRALLASADSAISGRVYPAYRKLIAHAEELERNATEDDGVWRHPDGDAYYAHTLRSSSTTDLSAEQIHQLGLREVERIETELRPLLVRQGYQADNLGVALATLREEPRFQWPDTDEGRAAILEEYRRIITEASSRLAPLFGMQPAAPVEVERVPQFRETTAAVASYQQPAMDGSRPGKFFVNLRDVADHARFRMRTVAYHEAIPGHHFQLATQQQLEGGPFFRRVIPFTAYTEGWGLYAEQLAAESGLQNDPLDRIGYLVDELWRAVRLVVDTGIHSKRWTRADAIAYMRRTGKPEKDIVAEVERYVVLPGQATSYKVGQLKILELRERARARLGDNFDIRRFHDVVLGQGAVPLAILERAVDAWIQSELQRLP
ncbi:MAG TPA: DUF885 domain-containing protein [Gemmatimonadaceae bacterium]|nr:DUF885 domain-containing protein [Gemmatimonadaceae bacterium]